MVKEVKIVQVIAAKKEQAESELSILVNDAWVIVAAGGYGANFTAGFVVLQRDR